MPPDAAIEVKGLERRFGHRLAVAGVDLLVLRGEFLTIFGPNGAGKTTLLRILSGLLKPTRGAYEILGRSPSKDPAALKRRIGLISHASFLYGGLTARENLAFYARLYGVASAHQRIDALLETVGLLDRASDLVRGFSRGMQQRLSIARALLNDPEIVFLDEPYTGLDQQAARMLRSLLSGIRDRRRTVVMVTHNLEEGLELSSRVAIMSGGRLVEDRAASSLTRAQMEELYSSRAGAWAS